METLAFIHNAIAHEDPTPDPTVTAFENIDLKATSSLAAGLLAVGVMGATMTHADSAQALIYRGDRGSGVTQLQKALGGIAIDGVFGSETLAKVKAYQASKNLLVDGVAGPATLTSLGLKADLGPGTGNSVEQPAAGTAYVTTGAGLLVRNAPAGVVVGSLGYGQAVSLNGVTKFAAGRTWSKLTSGNWVASAFLSTSGGSTGEVPVPTKPFVAAGIGVNLRNGPAGAIIGGLPYGASLSLTGVEDFAAGRSWSQLSNGTWIASQYIGYP